MSQYDHLRMHAVNTVQCPHCRTVVEIRLLDTLTQPVFGEGVRVYSISRDLTFESGNHPGVIVKCGPGRVLIEWDDNEERSWCAIDNDLKVCL